MDPPSIEGKVSVKTSIQVKEKVHATIAVQTPGLCRIAFPSPLPDSGSVTHMPTYFTSFSHLSGVPLMQICSPRVLRKLGDFRYGEDILPPDLKWRRWAGNTAQWLSVCVSCVRLLINAKAKQGRSWQQKRYTMRGSGRQQAVGRSVKRKRDPVRPRQGAGENRPNKLASGVTFRPGAGWCLERNLLREA